MSLRRGFTVIELLTVFIIAGLIMAITLPKLSTLSDRNGVRAAKQQLSSYIVVARAAAIRRGQRAQFNLKANAMSVTVDSSGVATTIRRRVSLDTTQKVTITAHTASGSLATDSILFDIRGFAANRAARVYLIQRGSSSDSICVSALGLIARRCGA